MGRLVALLKQLLGGLTTLTKNSLYVCICLQKLEKLFVIVECNTCWDIFLIYSCAVNTPYKLEIVFSIKCVNSVCCNSRTLESSMLYLVFFAF